MLQTDKKYQHLNRYVDILPFDHTRVRLVDRGLEGEKDINEYINANFVDGPLKEGDRKIIGSQGPKENTYTDFWRMIAQENVTLIVTTCNLKEKGRTKCHQFWPYTVDSNNPVSLANEKAFNEDLEAVGIKV
jgi:protein tyrosine phosphatase